MSCTISGSGLSVYAVMITISIARSILRMRRIVSTPSIPGGILMSMYATGMGCLRRLPAATW